MSIDELIANYLTSQTKNPDPRSTISDQVTAPTPVVTPNLRSANLCNPTSPKRDAGFGRCRPITKSDSGTHTSDTFIQPSTQPHIRTKVPTPTYPRQVQPIQPEDPGAHQELTPDILPQSHPIVFLGRPSTSCALSYAIQHPKMPASNSDVCNRVWVSGRNPPPSSESVVGVVEVCDTVDR